MADDERPFYGVDQYMDGETVYLEAHKEHP